jgi:hypothetical protein
MTLCVLSHPSLQNGTTYVIYDILHNVNLCNWHVELHATTDACNIAASLLLDYTSYSQVDWRYIRYVFGRGAVYATVVHSDFFDVVARSTNYFDIMNTKPTFIILLQFVYSNISINSFFSNIFILLQVLVRSRLPTNMYINDM